MRAPVDTIAAPELLPQLRWLNIDGRRLRMGALQGRPVLIEFFDFCRPNSIRTLPYVRAWHERYGPPAAGEGNGLQVIGIHSPGFPPGKREDAVAAAVQRLRIGYPVLLDTELAMWREYENLGWPARYLFDAHGKLFDYHYGEGAYVETELAIQELIARARDGDRDDEGDGPRPAAPQPPAPLEPVRPEDAPGAALVPQSEDREGAHCGRYEAGGVWVVLDGAGTLTASGGGLPGGALRIDVEHPGAYPLVEHPRHTEATIEIRADTGLQVLATCFTPGLA